PLDLGSDDYPPTLEDTADNERVITWLRVVWPEGAASQLAWAGINATLIAQRTRVVNELLPDGTGEPDQSVTLSHPSIIPGSVKLMVNDEPEPWNLVDDLLAAGAEVPVLDLRVPSG